MEIITTNKLSWNVEDKTFSAEASDLQIPIMNRVEIKNPKTKVSKIYDLFKTDKDGSGEDTYGWWFRNTETGTKLLIIND